MCAAIDGSIKRKGTAERRSPFKFAEVVHAAAPILPAVFPTLVFQCEIHSAAGNVNDDLLNISFKTVKIELFEAEFDVDLFFLG